MRQFAYRLAALAALAVIPLLPKASMATICGASEPFDRALVAPRANPYGEGMRKLMSSIGTMRTRTIFMGDSIAQGWPADLRKQIFPEGSINFGAGGDTAPNVLWRVQEALPPRSQFTSVVILVGTTDVRLRGGCRAAAAVKALVNDVRARAPEARIYVISILPRGEHFQEHAQEIAKANSEMATLSSDRRVTLVEANAAFREACVNGCSLFREDHLHLTRSGYELLNRLLASSVMN